MLEICNYYEQLVTDRLWKIIEDNQGIDERINQVFIEDVACLALNNLPVCYVRNRVDKSANISELKYDEMHQLVSKAIAEAIIQVTRRPHDGRED